MDLMEILQKEERNTNCIFLYYEDGAWYAYERSAFYCHSFLGVVDLDRLSLFVDENECKVIRARIPDPDKLLHVPLLHVIQKKKDECVILCKIVYGGFYYWRVRLEEGFHAVTEKER